jgi:hypothetical protein
MGIARSADSMPSSSSRVGLVFVMAPPNNRILSLRQFLSQRVPLGPSLLKLLPDFLCVGTLIPARSVDDKRLLRVGAIATAEIAWTLPVLNFLSQRRVLGPQMVPLVLQVYHLTNGRK